MNDGVTSVEVIEDSPKGGFIHFPSLDLFQSTLRILIEAVLASRSRSPTLRMRACGM